MLTAFALNYRDPDGEDDEDEGSADEAEQDSDEGSASNAPAAAPGKSNETDELASALAATHVADDQEK